MKKTIYRGPADELYNVGPFTKFMRNLEGTRLISGNPDNMGKIVLMYYIDPQNVNLRYINYYDGTIASADTAKVTLFGEKDGIGEVERIVLTAAEEYDRDGRIRAEEEREADSIATGALILAGGLLAGILALAYFAPR